MKQLLLLCSICLIASVSAQAQQDNISATQLSNIAKGLGEGGARIQTIDTYRGTPYFSDWTKGYLILDTGARTQTMTFRYDMMNKRIEFVREKNRYVIPDKKLNGFNILTTDGYIVFKNGFNTDIEDINSNTLLRVIVEGKVKFLAHHTSDLKKDIPAYGVAGDVNEFVSDKDYYIVTSDNVFHEINDLEKNNVYDILDGENEKLKNYMDKVDFSQLRKEERIKKMLIYYNLLLEAESDQST